MSAIRSSYNYVLGMNITAKVAAVNVKGASIDSLVSNDIPV